LFETVQVIDVIAVGEGESLIVYVKAAEESSLTRGSAFPTTLLPTIAIATESSPLGNEGDAEGLADGDALGLVDGDAETDELGVPDGLDEVDALGD
jgi:hypothetical protein